MTDPKHEFRAKRPWLKCVMEGALWSLALAVIMVPFGYAAGYVWLGGFALMVAAYLASRFRARPFPLLDYSAGDFVIVLLSTTLLIYPLWYAAFWLLFMPMAYIYSWFGW